MRSMSAEEPSGGSVTQIRVNLDSRKSKSLFRIP